MPFLPNFTNRSSIVVVPTLEPYFADFDKIVPFSAKRARWKKGAGANCDGYTAPAKMTFKPVMEGVCAWCAY